MPPGRHSAPVEDDVADEALALESPLPPRPPQGWYTDQTDASQWRWWTGAAWADYRSPRDPDVGADYAPAAPAKNEPTEPRVVAQSVSLAPNDLRARIPAHAVIEKLIELRDAGQYAEMRSWHTGAIGERRVAGVLSQLGPEWTVLHSVPVGSDGSDIDHVLIGPPGVFTLNTKHHPGKAVWVAGRAFRVSNRPQHYLTNAAHEAGRAERLLSHAGGLSVDVFGIIVVVGANLTIRAEPEVDGALVDVVSDDELLSFLRTHRRNYSDEQVAQIAAAAARAETWSRDPLSTATGAELNAEFERIHAYIGTVPMPAPRTVRSPSQARPSRQARPTTQRPPRPTNRQRKKSKKKESSPSSMIGGFVVLLIVWGVVSSVSNNAQKDVTAQQFASQSAEQLALETAASSAAAALDANSPDGIRPTALIVTPGASVLQTDAGVTLVDLPDGTTAAYAVSADGASYSLTLTGPEYASTVTVPAPSGEAAL
ncbi:nuclease-related domain-containing protein [Leifsonia sp. YIM 134122]|uniref:Nuclease-related domain-containing protein n=1 Tax=Leifsonia stereocauli TaxID=3134136 RepID=A0ABU9W9L4_9MICO